MDQLGAAQGQQMAVLYAAPHAKRNSDSQYEYRTCSYFYYLTGVAEPEAAAIFLPGADVPYRLFVMPKDPEREMWEGRRLGVEGARAVFLADETLSIADFDRVFQECLGKSEQLWFPLGEWPEWDERILRAVRNHHPNPRRGEKEFRGVQKAQEILGRMRLVKDASEIDLLRRNGANSALAHRRAMEATRPGLFEYEVEAEIEYWFRKGGAEDLAYPSIVAGGNNATVLHYKTNRDRLKDGTLLLIDAGGEMGHYASDITRTFPVSGKFTKAQRDIYEIVLRANKEAIALVRPGVRFHEIHDRATEVLLTGLFELGLLKEDPAAVARDAKKRMIWYPHNTSHWLGLDVHDTGRYHLPSGESVPLEEGYVFTVEPGIYIGEERMDVPAEYRGIGIRIEDDVLVTASGHEVLTRDCPKEVAELEGIVGRG
ncbi:MAG: aminopeptidase P N-terminal domain-containing protein [Bdellovibrionales bacterium]|nr:aminopeptidase P N-terminal domain-containing protein [Bdellovibrionales bacterium]